ncbi:helicase [Mycobacterium avium]|uniref:helicase n=1 Tax=Mycobacterium avium TaxID=1764 RepID=UPI0021E14480|nr:helicase [Mycobacterium avium]
MVVVLLSATGAAVYLGAAVVARHRAQAASAPDGNRAAAVAHSMRVDDIGCVADGLDVVVTARVAVGAVGTAVAAARAGPATG